MPEIAILKKKSYLAMIRNAVKGENHLFRSFFITLDGVERDALADGALSCAVFASSVLYLQNSSLEFLKQPKWISFVHASVAGMERDMARNGWAQIPNFQPGAVITWEPVKGRFVEGMGDMHAHIGFFLGDDHAVSNSSIHGVPEEHHVTYNGTRKIERIWWHPALDE